MTLFWILFVTFIIAFLLLDLGVFHKENKVQSFKSALTWTCIWFSLSSLFAIGVFWFMGAQKGTEFVAGYLLEQSLSIDNVFVFVLIFKRFKIPAKYQYKVLFWGVFGALVMRALMILLGLELINHFSWIMYVFGAFLLYAGIKMLFSNPNENDIAETKLVLFLRKHFRFTSEHNEDKFFLKLDGKTYLTPLFLALILVEISDLVFAVDSIPAVFSITRDPFIVYTSNCFAILGLRSLYFVLAKMVDQFRFLHYGLGIVLSFIGLKMLLEHYISLPVWFTLSFIVICVVGSIVISLIAVRNKHIQTQDKNLET